VASTHDYFNTKQTSGKEATVHIQGGIKLW